MFLRRTTPTTTPQPTHQNTKEIPNMEEEKKRFYNLTLKVQPNQSTYNCILNHLHMSHINFQSPTFTQHIPHSAIIPRNASYHNGPGRDYTVHALR